jgi:hypothetical protein
MLMPNGHHFLVRDSIRVEDEHIPVTMMGHWDHEPVGEASGFQRDDDIITMEITFFEKYKHWFICADAWSENYGKFIDDMWGISGFATHVIGEKTIEGPISVTSAILKSVMMYPNPGYPKVMMPDVVAPRSSGS